MLKLDHISKSFDGVSVLNDISPVSYTHLDVYKRQVIRSLIYWKIIIF